MSSENSNKRLVLDFVRRLQEIEAKDRRSSSETGVPEQKAAPDFSGLGSISSTDTASRPIRSH